MKKLLALLSIIILFTTFTAPIALATEATSSSEKKAVVSILIKLVDRNTINDLLLNEMQYIKLKNLSNQYMKDITALSSPSLQRDALDTISLEELNYRYYAALTSILSAQQISTFTQQNRLVASK